MSLTISKRTASGVFFSLPLQVWGFPGGERGVKLDRTSVADVYFRHEAPYQLITARVCTSADLLDLIMVTDALRRADPTPIRLFLPYLPYARQDRVCVAGEAHSLKVFAGLINNLGFQRVTVVDPHSDVAGAVLDNIHVITQQQVIGKFDALNMRLLRGDPPRPFTLVSPDAGANKKTASLAAYFGHGDYVKADKRRNLQTGAILETVVNSGPLDGCDAVIIDDLIDGGATFVALAQALRVKGAGEVILYATHGIFSKGTDSLYAAGINLIFSTDSFHLKWPNGVNGVATLKLEEVFTL